MNKRIWIDLIKLTSFFALLFVVFIIASDFLREDEARTLPREDEGVITLAQEVRLGTFLSEMYFDQLEEPHRPRLDSVVGIIESLLTSQLDTVLFDYEFHIVSDEMVNAYTFPGGHIVINTGLIEFSNSAEELASVLAHELGHAQKRHVVDRLIAEVGLSIVVLVVTGGDASVLHEVIKTLVAGAFSRSQEEEADQFGLQLLEASGIHPQVFAELFNRLNNETPGFSKEFEWIMSHPHNDNRIEKSRAYEVGNDFVEMPIQVDWEKIREEL